MINGWFQPWGGRDGGDHPRTEYYECSYCEAAFNEWPGPCPECDQLVVRIVDRTNDLV